MAFRLDDSSSYVFFGLLVGAGLGLFSFWERFDGYTCRDAADKSWNEPEISPSEYRLGRTARPPERRELVLFRVPGQEPRLGRVVGVAGDWVELTDKGELAVNDEKPDEKAFRQRFTTTDVPKALVPRGCVFVLCDMRGKSGSDAADSRTVGPIELRAVSHVFPAKPPKDPRDRR